MSVCALRFVRAGALSHSDKGGKKDVGGGGGGWVMECAR